MLLDRNPQLAWAATDGTAAPLTLSYAADPGSRQPTLADADSVDVIIEWSDGTAPTSIEVRIDKTDDRDPGSDLFHHVGQATDTAAQISVQVSEISFVLPTAPSAPLRVAVNVPLQGYRAQAFAKRTGGGADTAARVWLARCGERLEV